MKAVLFRANDGSISVEEVPAPRPGPGRVLVRNHFSLLSAGTERARIETGQESLIGKARRRPDQVKIVLDNVKRIGLMETWKTVQDRLTSPSLGGYSSAGTVLEVGPGIDDLRPGQLVACAGGGYANHAELVVVPRNLCVPAPDGVTAREACFGTLGAIALQGIHQAGAEPGSRIVVIGLGLVGQITAQILVGYGYQVVGIDQDEQMLTLAKASGADAFLRADPELSRTIERCLGGGADAAIITAAARTADPVELAGLLVRDRATVVIVGDVTVAPPRSSYYGKELTISYSRSYGPGRYDPLYEEGGVEYPEGYVPWDERRNLAEVLRLLSIGRLDVEVLRPAVFPVDKAAEAYSLLTAGGADRRVAILLDYGGEIGVGGRPASKAVPLRGSGTAPATRKVRIAAVGAGSFAARMLLPPLSKNPDVAFSWIASASGVTSQHQGTRWKFARAVSDLEEGLEIADTDAVLVVTRHDSHGAYAAEVLGRGLGLFCEKPLAITEGELEAIAVAKAGTGAPAMVGFNRRFAPAVRELKDALGSGRGPVQLSYRIFAGRLSPDHWYFQPEQGGRILGEVCHFVDLANWLVGSPAVSVTGVGIDSADPAKAQSVSALLEYADGSSASIVYGGHTPGGAPKELVEVAADGLAAQIDDFNALRIWGARAVEEVYRGGPKGHEEEMAAFVTMMAGREPLPESDFELSLWSTLATSRLAASVQTGDRVAIVPATPALAAALGTALQEPAAGQPSAEAASVGEGERGQ